MPLQKIPALLTQPPPEQRSGRSTAHCMKCRKAYGLDYILKTKGVPRCSCGGIIKPDVVLYEEGLDNDTIEDALSEIVRADLLIVGGTSLTVYPASTLMA